MVDCSVVEDLSKLFTNLDRLEELMGLNKRLRQLQTLKAEAAVRQAEQTGRRHTNHELAKVMADHKHSGGALSCHMSLSFQTLVDIYILACCQLRSSNW